MQQMTHKMPLVAARLSMGSVAVIESKRKWTWRDVHIASRHLANRLDDGGTVFNLCSSYVGFLVTWLATTRRGLLQTLPASHGNSDLINVLRSSEKPVVVVDKAKLLHPEWLECSRCIVYEPEGDEPSFTDQQLIFPTDWQASQICLYTSGSTGKPEPKFKTVGQLVCGAHALGARIDEQLNGDFRQLQCIVSSVAPQHMFGIEAVLMLSLVHGIPVLDRRPLLPADVYDTFNFCTKGAAWIATPLHIRALSRSGDSVPHCRVVISSTMPLGAALASHAEELTKAPVLEIYGSTETGALAIRRTSQEESWRLLDGVQIKSKKSETKVWGKHFESPQQLNDQIEQTSQDSFRLLGRNSDLIKIAGRRASLAGLNLILQDILGLDDGVFYMPLSDAPDERLVLMYVSDELSHDEIRADLRRRIEATFMPRVLIQVERLPRTESGKVATRNLDEVYGAWIEKKANNELH